MKKFMFVMVAAAMLTACAGGAKPNYEALVNEMNEKIEAIVADTQMTEAEQEAALKSLFVDTYSAHKDDSMGLAVFVPLISSFCEPDEALALYESASDMIKADEKIRTRMDVLRNAVTVLPGKPYKEITGVDALSGKALSLSSFLGGDKPVLVDFWASWCGPCRREIKSHLLDLSAGGRVQIVGVAVWEDSVEDTRKAMSELGLTWPVIYAGGRENSPTIQYGVLGIPTLFLLSSDGTILASGHSIEEFADKL